MQPLFTCFTQNLNYAIGWMVIHSLWQATAIAIVSGIVALVVRKKSPQLRYWIHNAALLGVLVAAMVTFCLYYDFSKEIGQTIFVPEKLEAATQGIATTQAEIRNTTSDINAPLSMEGLRMYFNQNIYLIVAIWVMGVALFILKLLGGISYVYYLRSRLNFPADEYWLDMVERLGKKAGVKQGMELVESALVRSPLVVGYLKPMILFPIGAINKLNTQEVEAILAHEIAHVLRNDYIFNIIQSVIEALFYFHPAVWWISANIRAERENCCDDVAIALCGNSMTYAKALVSLQEMAYYPSPQMAMAFAGQRKNQLLFRVQRILKQPNNKTNVMEKLIATCLLLVMMIALSFGGNRKNNNFNDELNALISIENKENNPQNLPFEVFEPKDFLKFKHKGILDSFPVGKEITDGNYNYADNMFQAKLTVKDHAVVTLNINGSEIKANEIKNHANFINRIIMRSSAPPQYNDDNRAVISPIHDEIATPNAVAMPTFSESDGNMVVDNPDGSQTVISHPANEGNILQVVTTRQRDGSRSVSTTNKMGVTITETFDRNGKHITYTNTEPYGNFNIIKGKRTNVENPISDDIDIADLYVEMNDLKEEIANCECQTNTEFRKKLSAQIDKVLVNLNKGMNINDAKSTFKSIQKTWENGECEDKNSSLNGTVAMNLMMPNRTTATMSIGKNSGNDRKESDFIQQFFKDLVANGLVSLNTEINLAFSNEQLNISGKKVDKAQFERIKRDFERYASAKGRYSIAFNGTLSNLTRSGIDISGNLATSLNND